MKYKLLLVTLVSLTVASALKLHPTAKEIGQEYIVQSTANHYVKENMVKSDIDHFPNNYKILNGNDYAHDTNVQTGIKDQRYPQPYYPYYDAEKHRADPPAGPRKFDVPMNRYTNNIYSLDKDPYYGPPEDFRILNVPDIAINVTPVKMADLTDSVASNKRIEELESELKNLLTTVEGPKFLYDQTSPVYAVDPKAYYDPTIEDKQKRIAYLEERIQVLNQQMKQHFDNVKVGVGQRRKVVQNFRNKNKELTNKFVADSYYYQVGNSPPAHQEKDPKFSPNYRNADASGEVKNYTVKITTTSNAARVPDTNDNPTVSYDNRNDLSKQNEEKMKKNSQMYQNYSKPTMVNNIEESKAKTDLNTQNRVQVEADTKK